MQASKLLERLNIACGFVPISLTSARAGDWVSLKDYGRVLILFFKAAGTAGDDPTITVEQASAVAGTGNKALNFTDIYTKQGADLTALSGWTHVTQSAGNTYTDATSAEVQAMWAIEFKADELDVKNGFDCVQAKIGDVGTNAQLGSLLYILGDPREQMAPASMLDPLVD